MTPILIVNMTLNGMIRFLISSRTLTIKLNKIIISDDRCIMYIRVMANKNAP